MRGLRRLRLDVGRIPLDEARRVFPDVCRLYSSEQIEERQVALVVDVLVRPDPRYEELLENKVFRKQEA